MRYLWDLYPAYRNEWTTSSWKRAAMTPISNYLRLWDYASAARVDRFIANSRNVRARIWKTYRRESDVIHPPVDVDSFYSKPAEDYFLAVSELVPYKRIDVAVRLFSRTGRPLRIAGGGPEYRKLRQMAKPNIQFLGRVTDHELRELYARSRALLLPGEEDFGITAVEALSSGKPVIALGRGGALETVPPFGGVFYDQPDEDRLADAITRFERMEAQILPAELQAWSRQFSESEFLRKFGAVLDQPDPGAAGGSIAYDRNTAVS
jgi:glycosyltransferase involved in cell wall biosynthesis